MARSPEDLANLALSYLVRGQIQSLDATSPEAINAKQSISFAKESVIEEYDWPECRVVTTLTEASGQALRGWSFAYQEPPDVAKLWMLTDGTNNDIPIKYERGMTDDITSDRAYIYTNQAAAYARYGSTRVSVSRLSAGVFNLVAIKLAFIMCMPLTKDLKLQNNLMNVYARELNKVKTSVANAEPEVIDQDFVPGDIQARFS